MKCVAGGLHHPGPCSLDQIDQRLGRERLGEIGNATRFQRSLANSRGVSFPVMKMTGTELPAAVRSLTKFNAGPILEIDVQ